MVKNRHGLLAEKTQTLTTHSHLLDGLFLHNYVSRGKPCLRRRVAHPYVAGGRRSQRFLNFSTNTMEIVKGISRRKFNLYLYGSNYFYVSNEQIIGVVTIFFFIRVLASSNFIHKDVRRCPQRYFNPPSECLQTIRMLSVVFRGGRFKS